MQQKKIAVFFDCENVSVKFLDEIIDDLASCGDIIIRHAYHDWSINHSNSWSNRLQDYAIKPIHVPKNIQTKNTSDIQISIDVMKTILSSSIIDLIALVSSDSDFTSLAIETKTLGVEVKGFGEPKTHASFRNACSSFIELPINKQQDSDNQYELIQILTDAIIQNETDEQYSLVSQIGGYLKRKNSSFIAKNYGYKTWGDAFKMYPKHFEIIHSGIQNSTMKVKLIRS